MPTARTGLFAPRGLIAATGLVAVGLVGGGVVLAQTLNLPACLLCVLQRMLYLLLALEALLGWSLARTAGSIRLAALLMAACGGPAPVREAGVDIAKSPTAKTPTPPRIPAEVLKRGGGLFSPPRRRGHRTTPRSKHPRRQDGHRTYTRPTQQG